MKLVMEVVKVTMKVMKKKITMVRWVTMVSSVSLTAMKMD